MTFPSGPTIDALLRNAEAGTLRLDEDVAADCQHACDALLDELNQILRNTGRLSTISAYGTLASAQQLGAKFEAKAVGEGGMRDVIRQHIDTVTQLRDLFEKAGRAYREADARAAEMLVNTTDGP
ncbi:MAG TPA: hypothetical protein VIW24_26400 [Aldersonia sp.]